MKNAHLASLTDIDLRYFVQLLNIQANILVMDVKDWLYDDQYVAGKEQAKTSAVVNDFLMGESGNRFS